LLELKVLRSPNDEEYTRVLFYPQSGYKLKHGVRRDRQQRVYTHGTLSIDTSRSSVLPLALARPPETAPVLLETNKPAPVTLRVFVDRSIIEVFVNDRQCASVRVYPGREDSVGVSLKAVGNHARLMSLDAWQMKNVWK
ncbi:MAG: GH32 C-terminal domain-containing protein, partial [Verrucomicrobiota bacterium]